MGRSRRQKLKVLREDKRENLSIIQVIEAVAEILYRLHEVRGVEKGQHLSLFSRKASVSQSLDPA